MQKFVASMLMAGLLAIPATAQVPQTAMTLASSAPSAAAVSKPVVFREDASEAGGSGPLSLPAGPDPAVAWIFAVAFLGMIVTRRMNSPML